MVQYFKNFFIFESPTYQKNMQSLRGYIDQNL